MGQQNYKKYYVILILIFIKLGLFLKIVNFNVVSTIITKNFKSLPWKYIMDIVK